MQVLSTVVNVPTPGTPVRVTTDTSIVAHRVFVHPKPANAGIVYFGNSALNKSTLAGLIHKPLISDQAAEIDMVAHQGSDVFRLSDFYVDADTANDGVLITYYVL